MDEGFNKENNRKLSNQPISQTEPVKNSSAWIWILFFLVIILIIGIIGLFFFLSYDSDISYAEDEGEVLPGETQALIDKLSIDGCDILTYNFAKNFCYQTISSLKNSQAICDGITNEAKKEHCLTGIAIANNNIGRCSELSHQDNKDSCFHGFAIKNSDELSCRNIQDQKRRDACLYYIATIKDDESICELVTPTEATFDGQFTSIRYPLGDECYEYFNYRKEVLQEADCDRLKSPTEKNGCYVSIGRQNEDVSVCDRLVPAQFYNKDDCLRSIAPVLKDYNVCDSISDSEKKTACKGQVARRLGDAEFCRTLPNDLIYYRDSCLVSVAVLTQNSKFCDELEKIEKDSCYYNMVEEQTDLLEINPDFQVNLKPCDFISGEGEYTRDNCIGEAAERFKDETICERINDETLKDQCTIYILIEKSDDISICGLYSDSRAQGGCYHQFMRTYLVTPDSGIVI